jgi:hypothetical protein
MKSLIVLFSALITAPSAFAVGQEGKGGVAHVCRDPRTGKILRAELLDLYVGSKAPLNLKIEDLDRIVRPTSFVGSEYTARQKDLITDDHIYNHLRVFRNEVMEKVKFIETTLELADTGDAFPSEEEADSYPKPEPGCEYEQLAVYTPTGQVLIKSEIWGALSPTHQRALQEHEALYAMARKFSNAKTSVAVQKIMAHLFAKDVQPAQVGRLLKELFPRLPEFPDCYMGFRVEKIVGNEPLRILLKVSDFERRVVPVLYKVWIIAPAEVSEKYDIAEGEIPITQNGVALSTPFRSQSLIGKMLHVQLETRPGIDESNFHSVQFELLQGNRRITSWSNVHQSCRSRFSNGAEIKLELR